MQSSFFGNFPHFVPCSTFKAPLSSLPSSFPPSHPPAFDLSPSLLFPSLPLFFSLSPPSSPPARRYNRPERAKELGFWLLPRRRGAVDRRRPERDPRRPPQSRASGAPDTAGPSASHPASLSPAVRLLPYLLLAPRGLGWILDTYPTCPGAVSDSSCCVLGDMPPFPLGYLRPVPAQLREPTAPELLLPQSLHPRAPLTRLTPALCTGLQRSARSMPEGDATCGEKLLISSDFSSPLCLETWVSRPAAQLLSSHISEHLTSWGLFFSFFPRPCEKTDKTYNLIGTWFVHIMPCIEDKMHELYLTKTSL